MATHTHDFWVTIQGERGEEWKTVAGTNRFPVQSPLPVLAMLPDVGVAPVFLLALDQIEESTRERIVSHLAAKFGMSPEETRQEVSRCGIPILDDECCVVVHNSQRWLI